MLRLDGVHAGYGDVPVLRDVSLVVPAGSVVALLGPNGAGKTTLLRTAAGLLRPTMGTVAFRGEKVGAVGPADRAQRGVCLIPEGRGIFRDLTVAENLVLFSGVGNERDGTDRALDAFPQLGERLSQVAGTMSGGEQQMLALTRAYVRFSPVVMLDEVSMGLAPKVVDAIFEFLGRLSSEGSALLLVEQYVHKALDVARYAYVLEQGRVVFAGEPGELDQVQLAATYLAGSSH